MKAAVVLTSLLAIGIVAKAQAVPSQPAFEVASVRPSLHKAEPATPLLADIPVFGEMRGGPGTAEPERIFYSGVSLTILIKTAYGLPVRQISAPAWLDSVSYDINAKIPPRATPEQFQAMLQNLLAERFGLVVHHETKESPAYDLVLAKNGPKLKRSAAPSAPGKITVERSGGRTAVTFRGYSLGDLAKWLRKPLANVAPRNTYQTYAAAPVLDKTGLTGEYDFTLEFAGDLSPGGAIKPQPPSVSNQDGGGVSLFVAMERQLGLKLEQKKEPLDLLVIDHAEQVPSEN